MTKDAHVLATTPDGAFGVRAATRAELPALHAVQRTAFLRIALALGMDPAELPPVAEELRHLEDLWDRSMVFLVATDSLDEVVGTVRGELTDGTVHVGRLAVLAEYRLRGIGTALMNGLEAVFPHAERFELFTGAEASVPIHLYEKLGYSVTSMDSSQGWDLVWLSKRGPGMTRGA